MFYILKVRPSEHESESDGGPAGCAHRYGEYETTCIVDLLGRRSLCGRERTAILAYVAVGGSSVSTEIVMGFHLTSSGRQTLFVSIC